jgi:two-component system, sensor histidine kinase and response regulator
MIKILVVEDDNDVRQNICDLLEAEKYQIRSAENGLQALEVLQDYFPDLIICDVMMPEMNGHQLLAKISTIVNYATIPFVFLTARADPFDHREGMNLGADDYLTKPFTRDQLLSIINARLKKSEIVEEKFEGQIDELRSNIAVSLPHELRTPLTGIMGFSEYLLDNIDTTDKEELKEYLTYIYNSGKRLNRLVENYISFTELQLKRLNPNASLSPITKQLQVLEYTVQISQNVAYEHDRHDDLDFDLDDCIINVAEKDFEKICTELIDNAFRFSKSGQKVHISAKQKNGYIVFSVRDHGIGINPAQIQRLGGFVQVDRSKNEQQGSGLGLTIARQLVELLGGTFNIESKEKFGTTVSFTLPG